jgi:hypothetical protein
VPAPPRTRGPGSQVTGPGDDHVGVPRMNAHVQQPAHSDEHCLTRPETEMILIHHKLTRTQRRPGVGCFSG